MKWLLVVLAACGSTPPPAPHQVVIEPNDVAILYPASGGLAAAEIVPRAIYTRAFGSELQLGGTPAVPALDTLHLVSIRIDPQHDQLRFVFQPRGDRDDAVHAVFELADGRALAERIAALRGDAHLGALAPHPLLAREPNGPFATGLAELIRTCAQPAKLSRITVFTSSGLGTAWNFFGVDVVNGATKPLAIPTLPAGTHLEAFFAGFEGDFTGEVPFTPVGTGDDLRLLANRDHLARATAVEQQRALAAAARIEDPAIHTAETIDCASCHVAHLVQVHGALDLHMFSYDHGRASIQPRAIREVDATVAALNPPR